DHDGLSCHDEALMVVWAFHVQMEELVLCQLVELELKFQLLKEELVLCVLLELKSQLPKEEQHHVLVSFFGIQESEECSVAQDSAM
ncbi:hypothetical protein DXG01_012302, partial [Tephrocybe rancida]